MKQAEATRRHIYSLYWKISHLREQYESREITTFLQRADEAGIENCPRNITSIHVIDCIGNNEPINNTAIAEKMELSKASITKISTKLLEDGFIKRIRLNNNRKEIYYRLSLKGQKLFILHEKLHKQEEERFYRFLERYTEDEVLFIQRYYEDMAEEWERKLTAEVGFEV
ncbi:MarR family transcriptional regulator [Paenibacillus sp. GCM10027626]|uniref:MarR family transcriptional regulator n=1 Tax=Paenibacillus sp. GCM10027626 TaxID=3273411 RepID=UPI0036418FD7